MGVRRDSTGRGLWERLRNTEVWWQVTAGVLGVFAAVAGLVWGEGILAFLLTGGAALCGLNALRPPEAQLSVQRSGFAGVLFGLTGVLTLVAVVGGLLRENNVVLFLSGGLAAFCGLVGFFVAKPPGVREGKPGPVAPSVRAALAGRVRYLWQVPEDRLALQTRIHPAPSSRNHAISRTKMRDS